MANVLVTNDDGAGADGLRAAARAAVAAGHRVTVVAPAGNVSTFGTALGDFADAWHTALPLQAPAGADLAFTMDSYPAAIVALAALGAFGPRPDFVVSGVNHGANTGVAVIHSATVAGALTAAMHGIPAVAVSADRGNTPADWAALQRALETILCQDLDGWPTSGALNVNLPAALPADPRDVVWCEPARTGVTVGRLERATRPDGSLDLRAAFRSATPMPPEDTDSGALMRGRVTLCWTPVPGAPAPTASWHGRLVSQVRQQWPGRPAAGQALKDEWS